jgi:hypothetical protein
MNAARLQACLAAIGWSQRGLATALGCDEKLIRLWGQRGEVPPDVAAWLEVRARDAEATPAPVLDLKPGRPRLT